MKSKRKSGRDFDVRLGTAGSSADQIRRARRTLLALEKNRAEAGKSTARELRSLSASHRTDLSDIVGAGVMRKLRELRKNRSTMTRAQRNRRVNALLNDEGVDRAQLRRLQKTYPDDARALLSPRKERLPWPPRLPALCDTPWVTYRAPYAGWSWSYHWERTSNPGIPELTRHYEYTTGRMGSSIRTLLSGADDGDGLVAENYTGLNVWHTAQITGQLEAYLVFEFFTSDYSGKVKDEFGISGGVWKQGAGARFLALQSDTQFDTQDTRIFERVDTDSGDGTSWTDYAESRGDMHSYYFRTAATFDQGSPLLLEAGLTTLTWFQMDDEGIATFEDFDVRLDRIVVRSCPDIFF